MTSVMRKRLGRAVALVGVGLTVQLLSTLYWTPLTFVLATALGAGPVAVGMVLFLWTVWQIIERGERS